MRKIIKSMLCAILAVSLTFAYAPSNVVNAATGPDSTAESPCYLKVFSYSSTMELSDEAWLYVGGFFTTYTDVKTTTIANASYDKSTNTLNLNGYNNDNIYIEANMMGDDFKIDVTGNNSIAGLRVWGDHYGGSVEITGTGSLTINKTKKNVLGCGVYMPAEETASRIVISNTVEFVSYRNNLYQSSTGDYTGDLGFPIYVRGTKLSKDGIVSLGNMSAKVDSIANSTNAALYDFYIAADVVISSRSDKATSTTSTLPTTEAPKTTKKVALNNTSITLPVGDSTTLKMLNSKKKVTWSIKSGKSYITLKNKKKKQVTVVGKKPGTAKVIGKIGKKKYTATVKVRKKTEVELFTDFINAQIKAGAKVDKPGTEEFTWMYNTDDNGHITYLQLYNLVGNVSLKDYPYLETLNLYNYNIDDPYGENKLPVANKIKSLDLSKNTALKEVTLSKIELSNLNLSKANELSYISITDCTIDTFNPGGKTTLKSVGITGSSIKGGISFKDYVGLEFANIVNNKLVKSLDFSGCTAFDQANLFYNNLEELNVDGCTALYRLECYGNNLSTLSVAGLTELRTLYCSDNKLTSLKIWDGTSNYCPNLCILGANNNKLVTLDVRGTRVYDSTLNSTERMITYDEGVEIIQ